MITRRKLLVALGLVSLTVPFGTFAQQPSKVRRIGFLATRSRSTASDPDIFYDAFVQGMRELGYIEGKNLAIEWRFAEGKFERLPDLADVLVQTKPEVIVTHTTPATEALQRATKSIPVVTAAIADPVASGFATSLARPGGNITGLSTIGPDVSTKQLELLKTILPKLSRVAVLANPGTSAHPAILKSLQTSGRRIGINVLPIDARTSEEIDRGFATVARERAGAVLILIDGFFLGQRRQLAELAAKHRMPSMSPFREHVEAGVLMSYGQNLADQYRRAATFVDKILKGAKPGEIPFEQPTKIHLAINRKTAKALGLVVPQELLLRADEVIE